MTQLQKMDENQAVATVSDSAAIIQIIERAATNPDVDIDKMERLLEMHERIQNRQSEQAFNQSMTECQEEMDPVRADALNKQTKSKYASYAALDRALRPVYTKHGFAVSYDTGDDAPDLHVRVLAHVTHRGGFSKTYRADMPADGKGAKGGDVMTKTHATGSAMSYGMRYLLKMIFNVAVGEHDDDGNAAANDAPCINAKQIQELNDLAAAVGANEKKFFEYVEVGGWHEIRADKFEDAKRVLNAKRTKS